MVVVFGNEVQVPVLYGGQDIVLDRTGLRKDLSHPATLLLLVTVFKTLDYCCLQQIKYLEHKINGTKWKYLVYGTLNIVCHKYILNAINTLNIDDFFLPVFVGC